MAIAMTAAGKVQECHAGGADVDVDGLRFEIADMGSNGRASPSSSRVTDRALAVSRRVWGMSPGWSDRSGAVALQGGMAANGITVVDLTQNQGSRQSATTPSSRSPPKCTTDRQPPVQRPDLDRQSPGARGPYRRGDRRGRPFRRTAAGLVVAAPAALVDQKHARNVRPSRRLTRGPSGGVR